MRLQGFMAVSTAEGRGHADEKSHVVYTHTKLETSRKAIETLPRLQ